ncbi:hypothetical protein [Streptomyces sp. WAC08241]|nr:hypothetical protein [Streptomyces sp. WAC08241]
MILVLSAGFAFGADFTFGAGFAFDADFVFVPIPSMALIPVSRETANLR